MKPVEARIPYYLRKVNEHMAIRSPGERNNYRENRLIKYKILMHQQIEREKRKGIIQ